MHSNPRRNQSWTTRALEETWPEAHGESTEPAIVSGFPTAAPAAARAGVAEVAGYETILPLGSGGMGTAYLARAKSAWGFERLLVIKRLHPHLLEQRAPIRCFLEEARIAACVNHVNVVGIQQVGTDREGPFLVLDYVEGVSLAELIDYATLRGTRLTTAVAVRILLDCLEGLHAIHQAKDTCGRALGILHRDLTPHNVLVGCDGVSRIADFGVAHTTERDAAEQAGYLVGKLLFMPPEYLRRETVGPSFDVYSLGVTLWHALTGRQLFEERSEAALCQSICAEGVPAPSTLGVAMPSPLEEVLMRACARVACERFQSALEFRSALRAVAAGAEVLGDRDDVTEALLALTGHSLERRRQRVAQTVLAVADLTRTEVSCRQTGTDGGE